MLTVRAPASAGNLGSGFDALGLALDLCNEFSAEPAERLLVQNLGAGSSSLPNGPDHLVVRAVQRAFDATGRRAPPLRLRCLNRIPLSRGLGSSSSAIAGGLLLGNRLQGDPLSLDQVLELATEMEGHPDNVVACLLGGVQISVADRGRVLHCGVPLGLPLEAVLFVPDFQIDTHQARRLLPERVPLTDAVFNLGRSALLVAALSQGRLDLLRTALEDRLHQPPRSALFPAMPRLFTAALEAGAAAVCLSGAGSTILALAVERFDQIGAALTEQAGREGLNGSIKTVAIRGRGAEIVEGPAA
jgi:homoserine kinase